MSADAITPLPVFAMARNTTSVPTSASASTGSASSNSPVLHPTAKNMLVVSSVLFLCVIISGLAYIWWDRRRRKRQLAVLSGSDSESTLKRASKQGREKGHQVSGSKSGSNGWLDGGEGKRAGWWASLRTRRWIGADGRGGADKARGAALSERKTDSMDSYTRFVLGDWYERYCLRGETPPPRTETHGPPPNSAAPCSDSVSPACGSRPGSASPAIRSVTISIGGTQYTNKANEDRVVTSATQMPVPNILLQTPSTDFDDCSYDEDSDDASIDQNSSNLSATSTDLGFTLASVGSTNRLTDFLEPSGRISRATRTLSKRSSRADLSMDIADWATGADDVTSWAEADTPTLGSSEQGTKASFFDDDDFSAEVEDLFIKVCDMVEEVPRHGELDSKALPASPPKSVHSTSSSSSSGSSSYTSDDSFSYRRGHQRADAIVFKFASELLAFLRGTQSPLPLEKHVDKFEGPDTATKGRPAVDCLMV